MAITRYHNVLGTTSEDAELLAPGAGASNLKSILLTNTHVSADATITLYLYKASTAKTYNIINKIAVPSSTSLLLDDSALLRFDNSRSGYGLYITVGATDTVDVFINP